MKKTLLKLSPIILIFLIALLWKPILHSKVKNVCAKYIGTMEVRGGVDYIFEYYVNDEKYKMGQGHTFFKVDTLELKDKTCIKLEYSCYVNSSAIIVDMEVLK